MLGPVLVGQWLSLRYYRRECRAWDRVNERVWIGSRLSHAEARQAGRKGVTAVLDLSVEMAEARPLLRCEYLYLPVLDLTASTQAELDQAVAFLSEQSRTGTVYVHCKVGYSRSAAVIAAYLLYAGAVRDADEAIRHLRQIRPTIVIRPEAEAAVRAYELRRQPATRSDTLLSQPLWSAGMSPTSPFCSPASDPAG